MASPSPLPARSRRPLRRWLLALPALGALLVVPLALPAPATAAAPAGPRWQLLPAGTESHLRGLDAVSSRVAWAGGYAGVVLRTVDGGRHWTDVGPRNTGTRQFRDIEAADARQAVAMAAGSAGDARLYFSATVGTGWKLAYVNTTPTAFFDCMAFFDRNHGLTLSDPVNGKFRILATADGGRSWHVQPSVGMPPALTGEFAFAASGTCLVTKGPRDAWFGTGGIAAGRVFHSTDGGRTWTVAATPVQGGASGGIFSLAFRDRRTGIAIGGDFAAPATAPHALARTTDGGATWTAVTGRVPAGYRSGAAWVPGSGSTVIAVGLTGSDISSDAGRSWRQFDDGQFDSVDCAPDGACWASGDLGRIARLRGLGG